MAIAALVVVAGGLLFFQSLPDVTHLVAENPAETALMRERGGGARTWLPLERVSEHLVHAVVMAEDAGFFHHDGFDYHELREAFRRNWEEGRIVRGASTITQQLAKNLFLSTERTYWRKLKEAVLTYRLESTLSKERILELYLNVIEWGPGVFGAEAASRRVFGKSAETLDVSEAALLAAMIPNPVRLDPCRDLERLRPRQERILGWMKMADYVTDDELERALAARPRLRCAS